jgi:hypothetical protein
MAQGSTQASAQTQVQTVLLRECSWVIRVFDSSGNEIKPSTMEINRTGRFEAWSLPNKAIIATVDPFHDEDVDAYRVVFYCYNGSSIRRIGIVLVPNPEDVVSHVKDALARCQ